MTQKATTRRINRAPRRQRSVDNRAERVSASLRAFHALLRADQWLVVAKEAVQEAGHNAESNNVDQVRRLLAERLGQLQDSVYSALGGH